MLARIANNLYWTGRYLERSEHLARYLSVQYFSMLDAPVSQGRDFTLASIQNMYGIEGTADEPLQERKVLEQVGMDYGTPLSIRSTIRAARENASALRHLISTELWEAINAYYLYSNKSDPEYFVTHGLQEFTEGVGRHCAIIRSRLDDTILHDDTWVLLKLGIHLERTAQVIRILSSKLHDVEVMAERGASPAVRQYQGTVILKILEGFDMHQKLYRRGLSPKTVVEFIISHPHFARSLAYNMGIVHRLIERIENDSANLNNPLLFRAGKLHTRFRYLEKADIDSNIGEHLEVGLREVYALHGLIAERYFTQ